MEEDKEFEAELLKLDENGEIYLGRPLPQEEDSESSAKSLENSASTKHHLCPLKSGSKNIKAVEQYKSDVKYPQTSGTRLCKRSHSFPPKTSQQFQTRTNTGQKAQKQYNC